MHLEPEASETLAMATDVRSLNPAPAPAITQPVDAAQALFLGTLAPGVNAPTWAALQVAMLALGVSLAALLFVALGSTSQALLFHVLLLIVLAGTLFALLSWFIAETGLVTVEQQLKDLSLDDRKQS